MTRIVSVLLFDYVEFLDLAGPFVARGAAARETAYDMEYDGTFGV